MSRAGTGYAAQEAIFCNFDLSMHELTDK
jgi:hypothetical protein